MRKFAWEEELVIDRIEDTKIVSTKSIDICFVIAK